MSPVWARNPSITGGPALKALEPVLDDRGELDEIVEPDVTHHGARRTSRDIRRRKFSSYVSQ